MSKHDTDIQDKIGKDNIKEIKNLFKKIKETSEFEFIFFSKKSRQTDLTLEKYVSLLKFMSKRASVDKKLILEGNNLMMDIVYNPDRDTSYRCTLENKETIDKHMKKIIKCK